MIYKFFRKYFSIIFIIATFIGIFHHHNDFKPHPECKICLLQANISNANTPTDVVNLPHIDIASESIIIKLVTLHSKRVKNQLKIRAPPLIS